MKYMDILSMLIDKTQYCPDASSSELDQQIHCDSNKNLSKSFMGIDKLNLRFICRGKAPKRANAIQKRTKLEDRCYMISRLTIQLQHQCGIGDRMDRQTTNFVNPEIDPHEYSQVIFHRGEKAVQKIKNGLLNKQLWNNGESTGKILRQRHYTLHKN